MTIDTEPPRLDIEAMAKKAKLTRTMLGRTGIVQWSGADGRANLLNEDLARLAEAFADYFASIPERQSVAEGLSQEVRDSLCEVGVAIRAEMG